MWWYSISTRVPRDIAKKITLNARAQTAEMQVSSQVKCKKSFAQGCADFVRSITSNNISRRRRQTSLPLQTG